MIATAGRISHRTGEASAGVSSAAREPGFVVPHPRRAADAFCRSDADSAIVDIALHTLIEHFEQGVMVADRAGRVHFLNRAAQDLVRRGLLRLAGGCLHGSTLEDGAALRRILARCAVGRCGGSVRLGSEDGTLLVAACAIPLAAGPIAGGGAVLLRFIDPTAVRLASRDMLQDQFGLTPAEAALAVDILAGNDLAASATRRGITLNTARVHLRRIFEKTGTRRQAELMRLLLLCPQPIAAE